MGGDVFRDEYSLTFDGTNDHLNCGNVLDIGTADFTLSIWAKASDWKIFGDGSVMLKTLLQ